LILFGEEGIDIFLFFSMKSFRHIYDALAFDPDVFSSASFSLLFGLVL